MLKLDLQIFAISVYTEFRIIPILISAYAEIANGPSLTLFLVGGSNRSHKHKNNTKQHKNNTLAVEQWKVSVAPAPPIFADCCFIALHR